MVWQVSPNKNAIQIPEETASLGTMDSCLSTQEKKPILSLPFGANDTGETQAWKEQVGLRTSCLTLIEEYQGEGEGFQEAAVSHLKVQIHHIPSVRLH